MYRFLHMPHALDLRKQRCLLTRWAVGTCLAFCTAGLAAQQPAPPTVQPAAATKQPAPNVTGNAAGQEVAAPVTRPGTAEFTKPTRRSLTAAERTTVKVANQAAQTLIDESRSPFENNLLSLSDYADAVNDAVSLQVTAADLDGSVADAKDARRTAVNRFESALTQIRDLKQPAARTFRADVLHAQLLLSIARNQLAVQRGEQNVDWSANAELAKQFFAARLEEFRQGRGSLPELVRAASYLSTSQGLTADDYTAVPAEVDTLGNYYAVLVPLIRSIDRQLQQPTRLGDAGFHPVWQDGNSFLPLDQAGPVGTGLGDNRFSAPISYSELTENPTSRNTPLAYGQIIPATVTYQRDVSSLRPDMLPWLSAETSRVQAMMHQSAGQTDAAQNAWNQAVVAADVLYDVRMGLYDDGVGTLRDVAQSWKLGQQLQQSMKQLDGPNLTGRNQQPARMDAMLTLVSQSDPRGRGQADAAYIRGLQASESLYRLQQKLAADSASQTRPNANNFRGNRSASPMPSTRKGVGEWIKKSDSKQSDKPSTK